VLAAISRTLLLLLLCCDVSVSKKDLLWFLHREQSYFLITAAGNSRFES